MTEDNIEAELESQLASQREALTGLDDAIALSSDGDTGMAELLQMREELRAAVSELESALLEIKRARILHQLAATTELPCRTGSKAVAKPQPSQPVPPANQQPQQQQQQQPVLSPATASRHPGVQPPGPCHFRYMDGRWYAGRVLGPGRQAGTLSVAFGVPTRPFMLDPVEVMEPLVRPCDGPSTSSAAIAAAAAAAGEGRPGAVAGPQQRRQQQQEQQQQQRRGLGGGGGVGEDEGRTGARAFGELEVGRKALALLPGSRLFVPVEVVQLDAVRATATVLPLLPRASGGRSGPGGGSGGDGDEVVVSLSAVTKHAHVPAPEAPPRLAPEPPGRGGGQGGGGVGGDGDGWRCSGGDGGDDSDEDGGGSSSSVSALLRPVVTDEESGSEAGDEGGEDDGEGDDGDDSYDEYDVDDDVDMYASDDGDRDDSGGDGSSRRRRRNAILAKRTVGGGGGDDGDGRDESDGGGLDVLGHARLAAAAGAVDDAALLADWEVHGRGVASRLLVRMGYVRGRGLGSQGQGTLSAPEVLLLPERKGLGAVDKNRVRRVGGGRAGEALQGGVAKRKRRGGAKQQRKRAIAEGREARAAVREAEEGAPGGGGLFDFINSSLGDGSTAARIRKAQVALPGAAGGGGTAGSGGGGGGAARTAGAAAIAGAVSAASGGPPRRGPDRRSLMNHHDNVAGIQTKLARLQEMLGRHKDNRGLKVQIEAQMRAVQAELAAARSAAARAGKAISDKDAQKKWLKF